jgi:DICT domain-containing protein
VATNAGGLSIGELTRRSGVPAATLRSWEARHGFPRPGRGPGRRREYEEADVAVIAAILRHRAAGLSVTAAIGQATAGRAAADESVFAVLRDRYRGLTTQVMRKATLLALTRAIEDESCARATRPLLFAGFQDGRHYERSAARWEDLARTARLAIAFVGPGGAPAGPRRPDRPIQVELPPDAPLGREWMLVCLSPELSACVTGWELPGRTRARDADRQFEVAWTVDPRAVRDAAVVCARLAARLAPGLDWVPGLLPDEPPPPPSADLQGAVSLLTRMTGYLEARSRGPR